MHVSTFIVSALTAVSAMALPAANGGNVPPLKQTPWEISKFVIRSHPHQVSADTQVTISITSFDIQAMSDTNSPPFHTHCDAVHGLANFTECGQHSTGQVSGVFVMANATNVTVQHRYNGLHDPKQLYKANSTFPEHLTEVTTLVYPQTIETIFE